jgi:hypothetical protein
MLFISSINKTIEQQSGFAKEYSNTNSTPIIQQITFIVNKQVDSKIF